MTKPICVTAQAMVGPRWMDKVQGRHIVVESGCWEWQGAIDKRGYGIIIIKIGGRRRETGAHRASWIARRGIIPDNLYIDHLCRNRSCVNPDHLEPVTNAENIRRGVPFSAYKQRGSLRGCGKHGFDNGWVTQVKSGGYQYWCRTCSAARARKVRAKRKAAAMAQTLFEDGVGA